MKLLILIVGLSFISGYMSKPDDKVIDYVPDEITAVRIAEAVWLPIYGNSIEKSKPFHAVLMNDSLYWHVFGKGPKSRIEVDESGDSILHLNLGGIPHAIISKKNGTIIDVYHSR